MNKPETIQQHKDNNCADIFRLQSGLITSAIQNATESVRLCEIEHGGHLYNMLFRNKMGIYFLCLNSILFLNYFKTIFEY